MTANITMFITFKVAWANSATERSTKYYNTEKFQ